MRSVQVSELPSVLIISDKWYSLYLEYISINFLCRFKARVFAQLWWWYDFLEVSRLDTQRQKWFEYQLYKLKLVKYLLTIANVHVLTYSPHIFRCRRNTRKEAFIELVTIKLRIMMVIYILICKFNTHYFHTSLRIWELNLNKSCLMLEWHL